MRKKQDVKTMPPLTNEELLAKAGALLPLNEKELQKEFSITPDKAHEIYLEVLAKRKAMFEEKKREFEDRKPFPFFENADQKLEDRCKKSLRAMNFPYEEDMAVYWNRLEAELSLIKERGLSSKLLINAFVTDVLKKDGPFIRHGNAGNLLVAFLLGITNVNPLNPYGGSSLAPTEEILLMERALGFNLPREEEMEDYTEQMIWYLYQRARNLFNHLTLSTKQFQTVFDALKNLFPKTTLVFDEYEDSLYALPEGCRWNEHLHIEKRHILGQKSANVLVVSRSDEDDSSEDPKDIIRPYLILGFFVNDDLVLKSLPKKKVKTVRKYRDLSELMYDEDRLNAILSRDERCKELLSIVRPTNIYEVMKIIGLAKSYGAREYYQKLLEDKEISLSDPIVTTPDDLYYYLRLIGLSDFRAFRISETVRAGFGRTEPFQQGTTFLRKRFVDTIVEACWRTQKLSYKADLFEWLRLEMELTESNT